MGLTKANVEYVLSLLQAAGQRQDEVRRFVDLLRDRTWWRSPDGKLAVPMSGPQQHQLAEFMRTYAKELHAIASAVEEAVGPPPEPEPADDAV